MNDQELLNFFRRRPGGIVTQRDIELSTDVWPLQPLIFYLAFSLQAYIMVEIGTADGSTFLPMVKAAAERLEAPKGKVYSVDPSGCLDAKRLIKDAKLEDYCVFTGKKSDDFFKEFNEQIDLAVIDGDHAFPQVAKDIKNCCQRLSPKGFILATDFSPTTEWIPDYMQKTTYSDQCKSGVHRGMKLVLSEFPELSSIILNDCVNGSVLIGHSIDQVKARRD